METKVVYMTASDVSEAKNIGRILVEKRLAACVNILGAIQSLYWWEGKVHDSAEVAFIAKTTAGRVPELIEAVKAAHSYECPCIVSLPIGAGNTEFLQWIEEVTTPP
jgi:periplasmic divalent cation tolerance protein